jgi:hypothetical protein
MYMGGVLAAHALVRALANVCLCEQVFAIPKHMFVQTSVRLTL